MSVSPKRTRVFYKGTEVIVAYIPETKKWRWEFVVTRKVIFTDLANSEKEAILTAKKEWDNYCSKLENVVKRDGRKDR